MEELVLESSLKERLDKFITNELKEEYNFSRSYVQKLINDQLISANGEVVASNYTVLPGDMIKVIIPDPTELEAKPEDIDFEIVYEDEDLLVINKPNDLVVHPGAGNPSGTLVNGLLFKIHDLSSIGGVMRPGIVHRLDKKTSGLMIVAKNDETHQKLTKMLSENKIHKEYIAIVHGVIEPEEGKIDAPIGRHGGNRKKMAVTEKNSKHAITHFKVLKRMKKFTLVSCVIETGRTHQIRVHFSYIGHPVLGDELYAHREDTKMPFGQYLHSHKLKFTHPIKNVELSFSVEPPKEFNDKLKELEG